MTTDPTHQPTQEYDEDLVAVLESVWGEGFMSPGGTDEVDRVIQGLNLSGFSVLDLGCGLGGATLHLARAHGPARTLGVDIEGSLIERCRDLAKRAGAGASLEFMTVEAGPLPVAEATLDLVFSKDSVIHIADKTALAQDLFRALKPGGWVAASDWLAGYADQPSPEMTAYVEAEGLDFGLASAAVYEAALTAAGFAEVRLTDRNAWYREEARRERDALGRSLGSSLETKVGTAFLAHEIDVWDKMIVALDQGQLRPTHIRARKPG